ncbi:MAG: SAV_915 family protein [Propioniciclava sp.]
MVGAPPMPPVVYVPTTDEAEPRQRRVLMHRVADGRIALYTYSAPDRVDSLYRQGAPWVLCDVPALQQVHNNSPYDLLFVDVDPVLEELDD